MTHEEIEIQTTETRRVELPYFAKKDNAYYWVVARRKGTDTIYGHAVYSDNSIILMSHNAYDAFHREAVQISADEFFARWREAVAALQAMEGGAE
jgi:hypothetical protein